jgi:hypothetical protein
MVIKNPSCSRNSLQMWEERGLREYTVLTADDNWVICVREQSWRVSLSETRDDSSPHVRRPVRVVVMSHHSSMHQAPPCPGGQCMHAKLPIAMDHQHLDRLLCRPEAMCVGARSLEARDATAPAGAPAVHARNAFALPACACLDVKHSKRCTENQVLLHWSANPVSSLHPGERSTS